MLNTLFKTILLILFLFYSFDYMKNTYFEHSIIDNRNSTLFLSNEDNSHGSAIYIGDGFVLSAKHNTDNKSGVVTFVDFNQVKYGVERYVKHEKLDVILLKLKDAKSLQPVDITCRQLKYGEDLYTIGHPVVSKTLKWSISDLVYNYDGNISGDVNYGNSGGGVFDENGQLVGVVSASWFGQGIPQRIPLNYGSIVQVNDFCDFINNNKKGS